jgi:steroid delta-isomerase-like uncharacterized protein
LKPDTPLSLSYRPTMQLREHILPLKEVFMTTHEMVAFVQRGYNAYNAHQSDPNWLDYADEDVDEDCDVVDVPSGMILRGPEGMKQFLSVFSTAFPDSRAEVLNLFATEAQAVAEVILTGTHTGVMQSPGGGIPPSGRTIKLYACEVFEFKNKKITRHTTYYDALGFLQQLGVLPSGG